MVSAVGLLSVCLAATLLKLSTSVDDSVWLSKLFANESTAHRRYIGAVYLGALTFITLLAYGIFWFGRDLFEYLGSNQQMMAVISSCLLIAFAVFFLRGSEHGEVDSDPAARLSQKLKTAFVVSVIGSIDELLTFIAVLSTGEISVVPLLIGTLIAGALMILMVSGFTRIGFLMKLFEKVTIWTVIAGVGLVTHVSVLLGGA